MTIQHPLKRFLSRTSLPEDTEALCESPPHTMSCLRESVSSSDMSELNSTLGIKKLWKEYSDVDILDNGHFATVWKAYHLLEGKVFAIKQIRATIRGNSECLRRMQEVYALSACQGHAHILRYYESWLEDAQLHIRTEYCEEGSVKKRYPCGEYNWSERELWDILFQVALALQYLHSKGYCHLDVKMDNVYVRYLCGKRVFKLGDFGHARCFDVEAYGERETNCHYQMPCDEEGDKRYLCPTFLRENTHWCEADIYALGSSVFELALGHEKDIDEAICNSLLQGKLLGIHHLSEGLRIFLELMIHPSPSARPTAFDVVKMAACSAQSHLCVSLKR